MGGGSRGWHPGDWLLLASDGFQTQSCSPEAGILSFLGMLVTASHFCWLSLHTCHILGEKKKRKGSRQCGVGAGVDRWLHSLAEQGWEPGNRPGWIQVTDL